MLLAPLEANPQDDDLDLLDVLEPGETTDNLTATQASLYHVHQPKLAEMGFIELDRESGEIKKGPEWEKIAPFIKELCVPKGELPRE